MPDASPASSATSPAPAAAASGPTTGNPPSDAAGAASPAQQAQQAVRKLRLKVQGSEREVPEDVVVAHAQRFLAGEDKLREAQKARAEFEAKAKERAERLKKEWWKVAEEEGMDPAALAREFVIKKYGQEALTPEQQRAMKAEQEAAEAKAKLQEREQADRTAAVERHKTAAIQDMRARWTPALQALNVPMPGPNEALTPLARQVLGRMSELEEQNLALGFRHPPEVLAELTREDFQARQAWAYGGLEGEPLLSALGDELAVRVGKALVARRKAKDGNTQAVVVKPPANGASDRPRDPANGQFKPIRFNRDDARAQRALTPVFIPGRG